MFYKNIWRKKEKNLWMTSQINKILGKNKKIFKGLKNLRVLVVYD